MDILIRPYVEADFDAVTNVWFSSWKSTGVPLPKPLVWDELCQRFLNGIANGKTVHVAILSSETVAFLALDGDKLDQLFVAPSFQGNGIGKKLLDFVKGEKPGGFFLTTPVESRAGRFYEREGLKSGKTSIHPRFGNRIIRYDWVPI